MGEIFVILQNYSHFEAVWMTFCTFVEPFDGINCKDWKRFDKIKVPCPFSPLFFPVKFKCLKTGTLGLIFFSQLRRRALAHLAPFLGYTTVRTTIK